MPQYRLFSWGANSHGQLGHGDINEEELLIPRQVDLSNTNNFQPENIVKIVGGAGHTLLLDRFGSVYSCGWNDKGQAGVSESTSRFQKVDDLRHEKIVDVACGWDSSMALSEGGQLFVWGSNSHGQLGQKSIAVGGKTNRPCKELGVRVRRISMGLRHSAVVTTDSRILVSGAAAKGQLGVDLLGNRCCDSFVEIPDVQLVNDVSCGQHHTVAVTKNNEIFAWGDNKHGQLGIDPTSLKVALKPTKIHENVDASSKIVCGWTHSVILSPNKNVFCWGRNSYGQLGRAKTTPNPETLKIDTPTISTKIQQLSIGSEHNIALTDDGTVLSWGWNEHGNCGIGNTEDVFVPTKVMLPEGMGVLVGTGAGHSFAVVKMNC